jgi:hypothetical protein
MRKDGRRWGLRFFSEQDDSDDDEPFVDTSDRIYPSPGNASRNHKPSYIDVSYSSFSQECEEEDVPMNGPT